MFPAKTPLTPPRPWRRTPGRPKAALRVGFLLAACLAGAGLGERTAYQDTLARARAGTLEQLGTLRVALERALSSDVQRVRGLVAYARGRPDLDQAEFARVAGYLMADGSPLSRNIALARDLVISHVYPLAGNEEVLGFDYRRNREQWPMVERAIRENVITVAGPLDLVQGGQGVIARFPVFRADGGEGPGRLWGLASMVIDLPRLLEAVGFDGYRARYDLVLYGRDGGGREGGAFLGDPAALDARPVALEVQLPAGAWVIEATPRGGWPRHSDQLWLILAGAAGAFALGLALIAWNLRYEAALLEAAAELDAARQEAVAARETAEAANRAKTLFLSTMSHELRTPLNAIIGFTETMAQGLFGPIENPRYRGYVEDIHRSSRHLLELISDILDISRIEARGVEVQAEPLPVAEAVEGAVRLVRPTLERKRHALALELPAGLPPLHADPRLARQILANIVGNAAKYTPEGGRIRIAASARADGGLELEVADDGPGIAPDRVADALQPFVQLKRAYDVAQEGTGLGLPIAKRLIEAHGGSLEILPGRPHGTRVLLSFPPAAQAAASAA